MTTNENVFDLKSSINVCDKQCEISENQISNESPKERLDSLKRKGNAAHLIDNKKKKKTRLEKQPSAT